MTMYASPETREYDQPSSAFGATSESQKHKGPKGKRGLVRDIIWDLTADAVGSTTVPEISVGSAASVVGTLVHEYARVRLGTAAGTPYTTTTDPKSAQQIIGNKGAVFGKSLEDFSGHVKLATAYIPADTFFYISRVAGAGGSPAGTGRSTVIVDWF